jgi:hypothetical protein
VTPAEPATPTVEEEAFTESITETPAEPTTPAAPLTETEEESVETDLFGEPATEQPLTEPPAAVVPEVESTPAPTAEPAAEPAEDPMDSLFGGPATETPAEPAAEQPAAQPTEPPAEAPAAAPAEVDAVDLFGDPIAPTTPPAESAPAEAPPSPQSTPAEEAKPAAEEEKKDDGVDFNELFPSASNGVLTEPGGWASDASRDWNDREGQSLATARVVGVADGSVALRNNVGQTLNVAFADLSDADLAFLRRQIDARQTVLAEQNRAESQLANQ